MRMRMLIVAAAVFAMPASAQEFKRSVLQRTDVPVGVPHETALGTAEIIPGGTTGRHVHPGVEMVIVIEGEMDAYVGDEGPKRLSPGDSILFPTGVAHEVRNVGTTTAKVVATWMVEKGKPMAAPAPAK